MKIQQNFYNIIAVIEQIIAISSLALTLLWLLYALINHSGHTSIDPITISKIQMMPALLTSIGFLVKVNLFTRRSF